MAVFVGDHGGTAQMVGMVEVEGWRSIGCRLGSVYVNLFAARCQLHGALAVAVVEVVTKSALADGQQAVEGQHRHEGNDVLKRQ